MYVPMLCMKTPFKIKNDSSCSTEAIPASSLGGSRFPYKALDLRKRATHARNLAKGAICRLTDYHCTDVSGLRPNNSGSATANSGTHKVKWLNRGTKFNGVPLTNAVVKTLTARCNGGNINGTDINGPDYAYGWKAVAIANLGGAERDVWTIDHSSKLEHVSDGT